MVVLRNHAASTDYFNQILKRYRYWRRQNLSAYSLLTFWSRRQSLSSQLSLAVVNKSKQMTKCEKEINRNSKMRITHFYSATFNRWLLRLFLKFAHQPLNLWTVSINSSMKKTTDSIALIRNNFSNFKQNFSIFWLF